MLADLNEWMQQADDQKKAIDIKVDEIARQEAHAHEHERLSHTVEIEKEHKAVVHPIVHEAPEHKAVVHPITHEAPEHIHHGVVHAHVDSPDVHTMSVHGTELTKVHIPNPDHHHHEPTPSMYSH